ncbi:hypothetical protein [Methylocapsa acidiphila]|uniref:hypothetical protein n=1 Tax=Methylocapsa acidiphila TaxID=133552 RepID=UPI000426C9CA|nr:hypothetical protein [Methylocapsa acidiphila]
MIEPDWPPSLSLDRARPGTVTRLSLFAPGIEAASDIAITGLGVAVTRDVRTSRGRLDLTLAIAAEAPPGWRDLELSFGPRRRRLPSAFQVLDFLSSGGRGPWPGIGSHLI